MIDDLHINNITVLASEQISDDQDPSVSIRYLKVSCYYKFIRNIVLKNNIQIYISDSIWILRLKGKDARIILLSCYEDIARKVVCAVSLYVHKKVNSKYSIIYSRH